MRIIHALTFSGLLLAHTSSVAVRGDDSNMLDLDHEPKGGPHDFDRLNATTNEGKMKDRAKGKGNGKGQAQGQEANSNATAESGFSVRGAGGRIRLCPTGDCKQSIIDISMHHLQEMQLDGTVTANRIKNFMSMTYAWTAPVMAMNAEGVNVTSSRFVASLPIDGVTKPVNYTAEVSFYDGNGTSMNGNQIIDVPGGGLKFAVWINDWPFLANTNTLHLGLRVISQNKKGGKQPKGNKTTGRGRDKKVERVELTESMFLDSPALAQVDGVMTTISSNVSVNASANYAVIDYVFPKFTTLYYDPVASSDDSTVTSSTPSTSSLRSLASPQSQNALAGVAAALAMSALALVQL